MELNQLIKDLLFTHDSVVIPGLGAFEAKYQPAKINPADNTMLPPSKEITFNQSLIQDDGLMSNYIVTKNNCSVEDAKMQIAGFVQNVNERLKKGEKISFEEVGDLTLNNEQKIQFAPSVTNNLLFDSLTLPPVQLNASSQNKSTANTSNAMATEETPKVENTTKKKILKYALIIIPIILIIALVIWQFDWIKTQTSALKEKVFGKTEQVADKKDIKPIKDTTTSRNIKDTTNVNKKPVKDNKDEISETELNEKMKVVKTPTKNKTATAKYYLIAGSFKSRDNADKLKNTIIQRGFKSEIIPTEDNLFRVTVGGFNKPKEAIDAYMKFKASNTDIYVWLLKNE